MEHKTVCVVGLGYVGLPLAEAFSKHLKVIGYDIDEAKTYEQPKLLRSLRISSVI